MKCNNHNWYQKSDTLWKCKDCTATMPCKNNCAHLDCAEIRNPNCARCGKKVKVEDIFLIPVGGASQPIHNKCVVESDLGYQA